MTLRWWPTHWRRSPATRPLTTGFTPAPLPAPSLPPGAGPDDNGGAAYAAANAQDAGRIAARLLTGQIAGSFAVVMYNPATGEYWVDGPSPASVRPEDVAARYPSPFVRAATVTAPPGVVTPIPATPV